MLPVQPPGTYPPPRAPRPSPPPAKPASAATPHFTSHPSIPTHCPASVATAVASIDGATPDAGVSFTSSSPCSILIPRAADVAARQYSRVLADTPERVQYIRHLSQVLAGTGIPETKTTADDGNTVELPPGTRPSLFSATIEPCYPYAVHCVHVVAWLLRVTCSIKDADWFSVRMRPELEARGYKFLAAHHASRQCWHEACVFVFEITQRN